MNAAAIVLSIKFRKEDRLVKKCWDLEGALISENGRFWWKDHVVQWRNMIFNFQDPPSRQWRALTVLGVGHQFIANFWQFFVFFDLILQKNLHGCNSHLLLLETSFQATTTVADGRAQLLHLSFVSARKVGIIVSSRLSVTLTGVAQGHTRPNIAVMMPTWQARHSYVVTTS